MKCSDSDIPPMKLPVTAEQLLPDLCLQWEPIQNSHRIRSTFQMKCSTRSTCQMKCSYIPPIWNCQWQEMKSLLIYVCNESPFEMVGELGQVFRWNVQVGQLVWWSAQWDQIYPPQLSMDIWKTITQPNFHDRLTPPPSPIDHRYMADCYTDGPPSQLNMYPWKTITLHNFHDRLDPTPPPIDHRSMADQYTISVSWQMDPLLQLTINTW